MAKRDLRHSDELSHFATWLVNVVDELGTIDQRQFAADHPVYLVELFRDDLTARDAAQALCRIRRALQG